MVSTPRCCARIEAGTPVTYNYKTEPVQRPVTEWPGASVFAAKVGLGGVFHTYSAYARGFNGRCSFCSWMDLLPYQRLLFAAKATEREQKSTDGKAATKSARRSDRWKEGARKASDAILN